jgi:hypothetical protein
MMATTEIEKNSLREYPRCSRCGGLMTLQKFYSLSEVFWGWKCLLCGEIVDPVILENRQNLRGTTAKEKGKDRIGRRKIRESAPV